MTDGMKCPDNQMLDKFLFGLAKFKQLGNINLKDPEVLSTYKKTLSEIMTKDELAQVYLRLINDPDLTFYPTVGQIRVAMGYLSDDQQKDKIADIIRRYIIELQRNRKETPMPIAAKYYYDKLGRSQGIGLHYDDPYYFSKLRKLIDINWEPTGHKLSRVVPKGTEAMALQGAGEKKSLEAKSEASHE